MAEFIPGYEDVANANEARSPSDKNASAVSAPVSVAAVGIFLILLMAALYYARSFFLPIVLALLLTFTLDPLVRFLGRRGVPNAASAVLVVFAVATALSLLAVFLSGPITELASETPQVVQRLHQRFAFLQGPISKISDLAREVQKLGDGGASVASDEPQKVVVVQSGLLAWAAGTLADIGTTIGATLLLTVFTLASGDTLRTKLIRSWPNLTDKKWSLRVLRDIETEVSRYLLTVAGINFGVGFCVGAAMLYFGMPNPFLWGIVAALLNFIPFVGSLSGQLLMFAIATVTYPTLLQAALPPLVYLVIGVLEGSFVTPTILGRRLELSPVAVLIVLALTTWMWGLVGTIIGVPLLVVTKVFSGHFPALSGLGEFISADSTSPELEISG